MSRLNTKKFGPLALSAALLVLVAAQGCGSDDDSQAEPTAGTGGKSTAGASGKGNAGSTGKAGAPGMAGAPSDGGAAQGGDGSGNEAGTPAQVAGAPGEGGSGGEAGAASGNCEGPDGCYSCKPVTNDQFLNGCVEGGCPATFDNSTLPKLDLVGTL